MTERVTCPDCAGTGVTGIFQCAICRGRGTYPAAKAAAMDARRAHERMLDAAYREMGAALALEVAEGKEDAEDCE